MGAVLEEAGFTGKSLMGDVCFSPPLGGCYVKGEGYWSFC